MTSEIASTAAYKRLDRSLRNGLMARYFFRTELIVSSFIKTAYRKGNKCSSYLWTVP
jgi:hypothetical protein